MPGLHLLLDWKQLGLTWTSEVFHKHGFYSSFYLLTFTPKLASIMFTPGTPPQMPSECLCVSISKSEGLRRQVTPLWNAAALTNLFLHVLPPVALLLFPALLCGANQGAGAPSDLCKLLTSGSQIFVCVLKAEPRVGLPVVRRQTVQNALTCYS